MPRSKSYDARRSWPPAMDLVPPQGCKVATETPEFAERLLPRLIHVGERGWDQSAMPGGRVPPPQ